MVRPAAVMLLIVGVLLGANPCVAMVLARPTAAAAPAPCHGHGSPEVPDMTSGMAGMADMPAAPVAHLAAGTRSGTPSLSCCSMGAGHNVGAAMPASAAASAIDGPTPAGHLILPPSAVVRAPGTASPPATGIPILLKHRVLLV